MSNVNQQAQHASECDYERRHQVKYGTHFITPLRNEASIYQKIGNNCQVRSTEA